MTPDLTNTNLLCITQDDVIRIIKRINKIDGLDAAREAFRHMNDFFSGVKGWAETTEAVYQLIADIRKEEKQQSRKEKLEDQRAGASHFYVLNKAISEAKNIDKAEIDKMGVEVNSPGNNIARIIKIGEDDEK